MGVDGKFASISTFTPSVVLGQVTSARVTKASASVTSKTTRVVSSSSAGASEVVREMKITSVAVVVVVGLLITI